MNKKTEIFPVTFNCIKHHLLFISDSINNCKEEKDLILLSKEILNIGHSPLDLYTGMLPSSGIVTEISLLLKENQKFLKKDFDQWIRCNKGYIQMIISDGSVWTLRFREIKGNYIHIHPSRNSEKVMRVNASVLKSVILYAAWNRIKNKPEIDIAKINFLRTEHLSLPPFKKVSEKFLQLYYKHRLSREFTMRKNQE